MTSLAGLAGQVTKLVRDNSPAILTGMGVAGAVTTAYLSVKAGIAHSNRMSERSPHMSKREEFELVWDLYIPPVASGVLTVGCIIGANRASSKRIAAVTSILTVSEKAIEEYKTKVVEQLGVKKEQAIRDEISQQRVTENPPGSNIVVGSGNVLCCESWTGRYFDSSMEALRRAENEINAKLLRNDYVTLDDFYYILGLNNTKESGNIGWATPQLLELEYSTAMADGGVPCLCFDYNYVKPL